MTWADFYLICFLLGLALSVLSVLTGTSHLHVHLPHVHVPHLQVGHSSPGTPWLNFGTLTAFLAWFGGTGYLLERYYSVWFLVVLGVAFMSGLGGAAIVFWFLVRLAGEEHPLDPADYDMIGVLGKLSIPIRKGGTGELIYSQEGVRRVTGARSHDGSAITKGAEVVVQRYENGIAYVRRWEDLTEETEVRSEQSGS